MGSRCARLEAAGMDQRFRSSALTDVAGHSMTIRGGGAPNLNRTGPPLRSSATDAYYCIMVQIPRIYRIQVCGAMLLAPAGEPPQSSRNPPPTMPRRAGRRALARKSPYKSCVRVPARPFSSGARAGCGRLSVSMISRRPKARRVGRRIARRGSRAAWGPRHPRG